MANYQTIIYDGYDATNGFTTPWIDCKNAFAFSMSFVFQSDLATSTGKPAGTLSLYCSDEPPFNLMGLGGQAGKSPTGANLPTPSGLGYPYPYSGEQPRWGGLDSTQITQPVTTVATVNGTGTVVYDMPQRGFSWFQARYTSTGTGVCKANVNVKW